ncbi:MAG: 50S ribosomal protein L30 [Candidatus Woesearchaeota archaeon]|nr:50S ribosomal protein L30 [Candidatus Woesearchaeota archaeon]|tara:strand:- start:5679 stop:6137 length:459 start_codon:yes stop_codon:yes gene_type:complete
MEQKDKDKQESARLAAIRIRGLIHVEGKIEDTLKMLRLHKNNYCSVVPNTSNNLGMLNKVKDYITWGEIDEETFNMLVEKRGEQFKGRETDIKNKLKYNNFFTFNNKKIKKYFRLNAPRKGFGRKGIKKSFQNGGALGYRGNTINSLIKRMI